MESSSSHKVMHKFELLNLIYSSCTLKIWSISQLWHPALTMRNEIPQDQSFNVGTNFNGGPAASNGIGGDRSSRYRQSLHSY